MLVLPASIASSISAPVEHIGGRNAMGCAVFIPQQQCAVPVEILKDSFVGALRSYRTDHISYTARARDPGLANGFKTVVPPDRHPIEHTPGKPGQDFTRGWR